MYISDYIAFKGQSAKTQEAYTSAMKELLRRFGDVDVCSLTFNDVRDWKLWLDKGRCENTVRNYIVCLRNVLKFLKRRKYPVLNPEDIPVPKRKYTEMKYLTEEEMEAFLECLSKPIRGYAAVLRVRNHAIVKMLYATGLRNAELCSLDRDSIKNNTFTVIGKGNKPRICFVDDDTLAEIQTYLDMRTDNNNALFVSIKGRRIEPGEIRKAFENVRNRCPQWRKVHPHTIRHSYATRLLDHRVDIRYIKEFMGHSSLETTAIYTHISNPDLKDIYMQSLK